MAVTAYWYGKAFLAILNKEVDFGSDTIKVALLTGYVPDQDTHDYFNDVSGNEVSGEGYTAGGSALANGTVTYTGATNTVKLDADDLTWSTATISATHAVIYDATPGAAASNPLLGYVDFGGTVSSTGADFTITWNAAGIFTITPA